MKVDGKYYRSIWLASDGWSVNAVDQTKLPHSFVICNFQTKEDVATAIKDMLVRGAPLIGVTAAYGLALAMHDDPSDSNLKDSYESLLLSRPTAVNLRWALSKSSDLLYQLPARERCKAAYKIAEEIASDDISMCKAIAEHGVALIREIKRNKSSKTPVNILTHCNAGWLAAVDWGTALAPIYLAHNDGIDVHVWVDETRPRNQGASLTAWELKAHGIPHTLIVDNLGGHLMQNGMVDLCITGSDRTTAIGDVCNKVGTYLKALAAHDCDIPFYVALPSSTIDWDINDGLTGIPIEIRDSAEVVEISGINSCGVYDSVRIGPMDCNAINYAFDVTPARLVTGLITDRGICTASRNGLLKLYPEKLIPKN